VVCSTSVFLLVVFSSKLRRKTKSRRKYD